MASYDVVVPTEDLAVNVPAVSNIIGNDVFTEDAGIGEGNTNGYTLMTEAFTEDSTYSEDAVDNAILRDLLSEDLDVDDTLVDGRLVAETTSETFNIDDTMTLAGIINEIINDGGTFGAILNINGQQFVVWAANADTFAHSEYANFDFDSMCRLGSSYYGTKEDGVYELEGSNDAGTKIEWFLGLPQVAGDTFMRMPKCYLGFSSDGYVYLRTITDGGDERIYMFEKTSAARTGSGLTLGRGVKSRYWMFDLIGVDGADIELDKIEFYPVVLGRRVP